MRLPRSISIAVLGLALAPPAVAEITTFEELEACARANLPQDSSIQVVRFTVHDRADHVTQSRARVYWKRFDDGLSRVMLRMTDPPDQRGAGVLLIEKKDSRADMFMYLPELRRVRRVTTRMVSGSLFGTDFSYEDFERLQGYVHEQHSELGPPGELDGQPVLVVESQAGPESESAYERTVSYFDPETCVLLKSELYERGETPRKVLTADRSQVRSYDGRNIPHQYVIEDLRDGSKTEMVVEEIDLDAKIKRKIFSQRELETGAR